MARHLPARMPTSATGPDITSEETARIVVAIARHYARPGLPVSDLMSDAYLALLTCKPYDPRRGPWSSYVRWVATLAIRDRARIDRKAKKSDRITHFSPLSHDLHAAEFPEPSDGLVHLFGALSDREAEACTLVCGLDGSRGRSLRDVAWMTGLKHEQVNRAYRRGIEKLRAQLTPGRTGAA